MFSGAACKLPNQYASVFSSFIFNPDMLPKFSNSMTNRRNDFVFLTKVVKSSAKILSLISFFPKVIPSISLFLRIATFTISRERQLLRKATLDSKTREFQYKLLHRIIYTNKILYKMGLVPSPMCSFCGNMEETLEHLFIYCDISKHFWSSLTEWLNEFGFDVRYLSTFDIAFGLTSKDSLTIIKSCNYSR